MVKIYSQFYHRFIHFEVRSIGSNEFEVQTSWPGLNPL